MKQYKSKQRKKRNVKYLEVASAILLTVAIVSALVIWYNPNAPRIQKALATDYFAFSDITALYESFANTDEIIKIRQLFFDMTPVGGNATNVHIDPSGITDPVDYTWSKITNGTSEPVEIILTSPVQSVKNGTMFPIKVKVYSDQAEGYVTLQIPEDHVFPY